MVSDSCLLVDNAQLLAIASCSQHPACWVPSCMMRCIRVDKETKELTGYFAQPKAVMCPQGLVSGTNLHGRILHICNLAVDQVSDEGVLGCPSGAAT